MVESHYLSAILITVSRPHLGDARTIVEGQKVHVSVLFKHNYKPSPRFHHANEWPDPMFWNHESSHKRLQNLSDVWEKDIFDHHSVRNLIGQLNKGQLNKGQSIQEVLGRLAFMSTFGGFMSRVPSLR